MVRADAPDSCIGLDDGTGFVMTDVVGVSRRGV